MKRAMILGVMCLLMVGAEPATKPVIIPVADGVWGVPEGADESLKMAVERQRAWREGVLRLIDSEIASARRQAYKATNQIERRTGRDKLQMLEEKKETLLAESSFLLPTFHTVNDLRVAGVGRLTALDVRQVVDEKSVLAAGSAGDVAWIDNISTAGYVDEKLYSVELPLLSTGTKTYGTAMGSSKTVMRLSGFDVASIVRVQK